MVSRNVLFSIKDAAYRIKWVFVSAAAILLCFWLFLQHTAHQAVERSLAEQNTSNAVLLHALEDTVIRSFQAVNSSLQVLAESLPELHADSDINNALLEQLRTSPQLRALDVLDTQGLVLASATKSKGNIANYACLGVLNGEPTTEFVIEAARLGRYPNDAFAAQSAHRYIPFCVPVRDKSGQLSKVLVAAINPQYFYNLFASVTGSAASSVHLYRYDGEALLTTSNIEPDIAHLLTQAKQKSWGEFRTAIAEQQYLISYRSTSLLPLILILVSEENFALTAWKSDKRVLQIFLLVISVVILLAALVIALLLEKRHQAEGDIHLLSTAIRSTANAIMITNKEGHIYWTNNAFTTLTGYTFEEVKGKTPRVLNSGYQTNMFFSEIWSTILSGNSWRGELVNRHKQGHTMVVEQTITPILDSKGVVEHFIAVHEDVTARKNAEEKVLYLADHDPLTGLANRRFFERGLQQLLSSSERQAIAVLFLDLDRFKDINDTMGHEAGDALLIHTAASLQDLTVGNYLLARLGGDEFAILIESVDSRTQLADIANQVVNAVAKPFYYGASVFSVTCSLGVAVGDTKTSDVSILLRQADMAMYRAKNEGKNTFRFFDEAMNSKIKRNVYLQQQLEVAMSSDTGLSLRYQPQIAAATGLLYGAEALMRWQLDNGEWVSPNEFIPLAEDTGKILELGTWLMKTLFQQMAYWNQAGVVFGQISMNVSAVQLAREPLADQLLSMMQEFAIPVEQLCVEITESTLMTDSERVMTNLKLLKKSGVTLSIDDFGTGYSSMSYLKAIDANQLKIDRSFIIGIGKQGSDEHIVRATIALAHSLNIETVAEGVDSQEQLAFLNDISCDYIQGFLLSKPLTPADFERFIQERA